MKKVSILTILLFGTLLTMAQSEPRQKTISVSGTAEMEITPDEIYVEIELQEYQKKGEAKKDLEVLKSNFIQYAKAAGLPDSIISIKMYSGENNSYYQRKKTKNNDLKAGITYQVKFSNSQQMDELIKRLDDEATKRFEITQTGYSQMPELKKQLKIKAIQAAKNKALYLAEAIGEKVGEAVAINENNDAYYGSGYFNFAQTYANNAVYSDERPGTQTDFTKLKFNFSVAVVFALK